MYCTVLWVVLSSLNPPSSQSISCPLQVIAFHVGGCRKETQNLEQIQVCCILPNRMFSSLKGKHIVANKCVTVLCQATECVHGKSWLIMRRFLLNQSSFRNDLLVVKPCLGLTHSYSVSIGLKNIPFNLKTLRAEYEWWKLERSEEFKKVGK